MSTRISGGTWSSIRSVLLGLSAALSLTASSSASEPAGSEPVNLDAILAPVIARAHIPGMAAVVLSGDRVVAQGVAGVRKKGAPELITLSDQFELGSCTKAMTATLVAQLIEEKMLNWNTSLAELFAAENVPIDPAWKAVTVRQLLDQRTGISGAHPFAFSASVDQTRNNLPQQRLKLARRILANAPDHRPGKFAYSAVNYILAGAVVEKVTGHPWEDLMRERLYEPLGISSGGFGPPGVGGQVTEPWGHGNRRLWYFPLPGSGHTPFDPSSDSADYPPAAGPAGMAHMSVTDWAKFVAVYLRADPVNPNQQVRLLNADTFAHLRDSAETEYAAGWFLGTRPWAKGSRPHDNGRVFFHAGDNGRWTTVVWVAPEIDFAILIACNRGGMAGPVDEVAGALLRFVSKSPLAK